MMSPLSLPGHGLAMGPPAAPCRLLPRPSTLNPVRLGFAAGVVMQGLAPWVDCAGRWHCCFLQQAAQQRPRGGGWRAQPEPLHRYQGMLVSGVSVIR